MDLSSPSTPMPPAGGTPAWLRFALFCTLFLLAALWLEPYLAPLCRATALQVGALLGLAGLAPQVQGDLIAIPGFTVRIVNECTPLYACLMYCAFVLAQPASFGRTVAGLLVGAMVIAAANLLRISFVTAAGPAVAPIVFDILHVYLGQVAMLMLVVAAALAWLRWSAGGPAPFPFLLRAGLFATILFVPWVTINRSYVELLDMLVAHLFSLLYPGYRLLTPRPFAIYNHTFAVPLFLALALAMACRGAWTLRRLAAVCGGICFIAGWHAFFRVSHVVWTALDTPEIVPLHQAIYLLGQFLLPFLLWLRLDHRFAPQERGPRSFPAKSAVPALLLLTLCWPAVAAAEPVILAFYNGKGAFAVKANNLNRVTETEISLNYQSYDNSSTRVSISSLDPRATTVTVKDDKPGSLVVVIRGIKPMSGNVSLAVAKIQGTITFITASVRHENGRVETARTSVTNPTDEQLSAMAGKSSSQEKNPAPAPPPPEPSDAGPPPEAAASPGQPDDIQVAPPPAAPASVPAARVKPPSPSTKANPGRAAETDARSPDPGTPRSITFSRRENALERFGAHDGEKSPAALARLLDLRDDMFSQEPLLLIADGKAAIRLTVRPGGRDVDLSPQFYISGGNCGGLRAAEDGRWVLDIVPRRGSLETSVMMLAGAELIEYPLNVAPLLAEFDEAAASPGTIAFVRAANELAAGFAATGMTPGPAGGSSGNGMAECRTNFRRGMKKE